MRQKVPDVSRLRELLENCARVAIALPDKGPPLSARELEDVDELVGFLEDGRRLFDQLARCGSAAKAAAMNQELVELSTRVGEQLHALNQAGFVVEPIRRAETRAVEDLDTGVMFQVIEQVLRLWVSRPGAAS
jgi:hypothetical protein